MIKKSNQIAILDENSSTRQQLAAIDAALSKLQHVSESNYRTSMNLDGVGDLKQVTKTEDLIKALSSVLGREAAYNNAAKVIGLTTYPVFTLGGGNAQDWTEDIKLRIAIINNKETLDTLKAAKEELSKFLSEAEQRALAVEKVNNMLS